MFINDTDARWLGDEDSMVDVPGRYGYVDSSESTGVVGETAVASVSAAELCECVECAAGGGG